jgi:RNA polymerase sigma-70 factor, ECF subfamily
MPSTESGLIEGARAGDADAWDALVALHMRRAHALALRLLGDPDDAQDLVQDAFIAALRRIDGFEPGRSFAPWLLRIVFNRGLNMRKARARRGTQPVPATTPARSATPLENAERSELRDALAEALATLPERRRWIVKLFDIDGFPGSEIAAMLGIPEGTVRWELHQARRALRSALAAHARRTT